MVKKYLVIGGRVKSKMDGDIHYVSPIELCRLYGLDPKSENVRLGTVDRPEALRGYDESWIRLFPRYNGNYGKPIEPVPRKEQI